MVALPELSAYSAPELEEARRLSPALGRYENLLKLTPAHSAIAIRHKAWIECVLASLFQRASPADVCRHWSNTADAILKQVWSECGLDQFEAVLFALGKHGARELNLSSDIDVMIVAEPKDAHAIEKPLRQFRSIIHNPGDFGFCFRLDFDLRPGGKLGPLITSPSQFQDHYWSQGETWERLALVRLRSIAGSQSLSAQILDLARRFSYRKFLDFTLLDDLKALRARVHTQGFQRAEGEIHLKLEVGGIRDIELFVHSLLVLNGGKLTALQTVSTQEALERLEAHGLLPPHEARPLLDSYWFYRHAENLVQCIEDRQTHSLGSHKLPGLPTHEDVRARMKDTDRIVSSLLGQVDTDKVRLPESEAAQKAWLLKLGFSQEAIDATWDQLMKSTALSHKNDRDERARREFLFVFAEALAKNSGLDRDLGLSLLNDFVKATRAKATFFTTLLRIPRLIDDLARLFCLSPYLGSILAARPELLDHFILRVDEDWAKETDALLQQMGERKLLTELWSANRFLADRNLNGVFERVTETADSICRQLLLSLKSEFPDSQVEMIALGKWGGRELGLRSDLDFIFVTPEAPKENDFKVARRMISRLTEPRKEGSLYELDLRLRPSGQSGALLVAVDKLVDYWKNDAEPWQRQAYLRSRALEPLKAIDLTPLVQKGLTKEQMDELKEIRSKLLKPRKADALEIKYAPGGLLDIEFTVQTGFLNDRRLPPSGNTTDMLQTWAPGHPRLREIYLQLREFEQMIRLGAARKISEVGPGHPAFLKAAAYLGQDAGKAWAHLLTLLDESRSILNAIDPTGLKFHI